MEKQELAELEAQLLGKIVAHLYLELASQSGLEGMRARIHDTLSVIDKQCGVQRPASQELHRWAEQTAKGGADIKGGMVWRALEEITLFTQGELGAQYENELRNRIEAQFAAALADEGSPLSAAERQQILTTIINDCLGFGPLEPILADSEVTEVLVNGPEKIYLERRGKLEDAPYRFRDGAHLMSIIHRIVVRTGRQLSECTPIADIRLPDGSRVNIVIPPISLTGPVMTIRKFPKQKITLADLLRFGTLSEEIATFLRACVQSQLNILISGWAASGKTTFLNTLAHMIPDNERIIVIENTSELYSLAEAKKHVISLESRPPNAEGEGEVSVRDLVVNALRMRPDRIIVAETRGAEAPELIHAMNTGHNGCLTTVCAFSPRDALQRLETMMAQHPAISVPLPVRAIHEQIASAIDVIVQIESMPDGSRKVTSVSEVSGMEGNAIVLKDIFLFHSTESEPGGTIVSQHLPTGIVPRFLAHLQACGIEVPVSLFTPRL